MNKWISRRASRQENKCKQTSFSITFSVFFCLFFSNVLFCPISFNLNEVSVGPAASTSPMLAFVGAEQICFSPCLFILVFVSVIVCVYTYFCWWPSQVFLRLFLRQFSAWSPLMCLSVYLLSQHSWFIYIYIPGSDIRELHLLQEGNNDTLAVICLHTGWIFVTYLWQSFTDSMSFIRYEVKSASRNVTHAFGKITSVVWIQSLWQPTANDTGGNFLRQRRWAILLTAGVTNWQIGTKSRLEEINVWWQNYACWLKCAHMHCLKMLPIQWRRT